MLEPDKTKLPVATVIKAHGIKGELNVELSDYAEPDEDLAPGACLIAEIDGLDVPFFVAYARMRGSSSALLTLDDINSDADARQLAGHTLYIYADPDDADALTAGELLGYEITDATSGRNIGRIDELTELTPGSWYFRMADGRLIPAVDEIILAVDHKTRALRMALPSGLLEL